MTPELRDVLQLSYVRRMASGQIITEMVWRCPITNAVLQRAKDITEFPHTHVCKWCEVEHYFSGQNIHVEPVEQETT